MGVSVKHNKSAKRNHGGYADGYDGNPFPLGPVDFVSLALIAAGLLLGHHAINGRHERGNVLCLLLGFLGAAPRVGVCGSVQDKSPFLCCSQFHPTCETAADDAWTNRTLNVAHPRRTYWEYGRRQCDPSTPPRASDFSPGDLVQLECACWTRQGLEVGDARETIAAHRCRGPHATLANSRDQMGYSYDKLLTAQVFATTGVALG
jgi:hypothetical protein